MTMSGPNLVRCRSQNFMGREAEAAGSGRSRHTLDLSLSWHLLHFLGTFQHPFLCSGTKQMTTQVLCRQLKKSAHLLTGKNLVPCHRVPWSIHWFHATPLWTNAAPFAWSSGCFPAPELAEGKGRKTNHPQWKSEVNADWRTEIGLIFNCYSKLHEAPKSSSKGLSQAIKSLHWSQGLEPIWKLSTK